MNGELFSALPVLPGGREVSVSSEVSGRTQRGDPHGRAAATTHTLQRRRTTEGPRQRCSSHTEGLAARRTGQLLVQMSSAAKGLCKVKKFAKIQNKTG